MDTCSGGCSVTLHHSLDGMSEPEADGLGVDDTGLEAAPGLGKGLAFSKNLLLTLREVNFLAGAMPAELGERAASEFDFVLRSVAAELASTVTASAGGRGASDIAAATVVLLSGKAACDACCRVFSDAG